MGAISKPLQQSAPSRYCLALTIVLDRAVQSVPHEASYCSRKLVSPNYEVSLTTQGAIYSVQKQPKLSAAASGIAAIHTVDSN